MTVEVRPWPPASNFTGLVGSVYWRISPFLSSSKGSTNCATLSGATRKAVSVIPSGLEMRFSKNSPSVMPETTSISRPSTSVEWLYHQVVQPLDRRARAADRGGFRHDARGVLREAHLQAAGDDRHRLPGRARQGCTIRRTLR